MVHLASLHAARGARVWPRICGGCSVRPLPGSDVRGLFPVPVPRPSAAVLHAQPRAPVPPNARHHRESYGTRRSVGQSRFFAQVSYSLVASLTEPAPGLLATDVLQKFMFLC